MKHGEFIKQVEKGTYLYIQDKNKIVKVTRVFPTGGIPPSYAVWENADGIEDAAIYSKVQIVPKETLNKLLEKKRNEQKNAE